jgi:hypothetical protein
MLMKIYKFFVSISVTHKHSITVLFIKWSFQDTYCCRKFGLPCYWGKFDGSLRYKSRWNMPSDWQRMQVSGKWCLISSSSSSIYLLFKDICVCKDNRVENRLYIIDWTMKELINSAHFLYYQSLLCRCWRVQKNISLVEEIKSMISVSFFLNLNYSLIAIKSS